ncbi:MAG: YihY/virulence factor BrkB family protein [Opitutales bacterium]|nr:YihY/virulence factor BrkB family protein [Opitutales bacterium]MCH8539281.1 YihY/virulence factor BrkB family protein [Opitutales bacterium]
MAKPEDSKKKTLSQRGKEFYQRVHQLVTTEIWKHDREDSGWALLRIKILRILTIAFQGLRDTKLGNRAAALSFSSLLAIGPIIAVSFMVSGFIIDRTDSDIAVQSINRVIQFVAPQVGLEREEEASPEGLTDEPADVLMPEENGENEQSEDIVLNPELVDMIDNFIARSQSGAIGIMGIFFIMVVAMQMLTSIETAFNHIWGVSRGRSWFLRIVFYWTSLTLGAVLAFTALGFLSTAALTNLVADLPLGGALSYILPFLTPILSFLILVSILAAFYRFMPNTHVRWGPAYLGAAIVAGLLFANNVMAFLYIQRVTTSYNLYGSVGMIPVLMFGLFVFWLIILLGAQLTYAVQNVNYLSNQEIWKRISFKTRELLSFVVLLLVARRFKQGKEPFTSAEIIDRLQAPGQVVNECLSHLAKMGYLTSIPPSGETTSQLYRYQPAKPLGQITLAGFHNDLTEFGNEQAVEILDSQGPAIKAYRKLISETPPTMNQTLEDFLSSGNGNRSTNTK